MAVTAHFYNHFFSHLAAADINLASDVIKLALCGVGYTPNQAADQSWTTPESFECVGAGYTAGGLAVDPITITPTGWNFAAVAATWTRLTVDPAYLVLWDSTPASKPLIGYVNLGGVSTLVGQNLSVTWDAAGTGQVIVS